MLAFLVQRVFQAVLVMFVISVVAFAIQDGLGDPLQQLVGMSVSQQERQAIREQLGLNDPLPIQYLRFAGNALQGDLGHSYFYSKPTLSVIAEHLPATLELVIGASLIILLLSVPIGVYAAIRPRARLARYCMGVSTLGISVPVFLTAIVLIQLFSIGVTVAVFPAETAWGRALNQLLSTEGGLPSYGRGEALTHLFLHALRVVAPAAALRRPCLDHVAAVHPLDSGGDGGGATERLHSLRPRQGVTPLAHLFSARLEEYAAAGDHRRRCAAGHHGGLYHTD
jgi:ABC-type dipeptide/oligopeptide/nickel transport system permease component